MNTEIYQGIRGEPFRKLIIKMLKKGQLKPEYISLITDEEGMRAYNTAFTSPTADPSDNYEFLELLGDQTVNKSIVWYLYRRFPQIVCPEGKSILSRLKINLVSKDSFSSIAKNLQFWDFITCDMETRNSNMKKTLEDVFESFFGVTEDLIDKRIRQGVGYSICYNIIENLFSEIPISLAYEDLFDPKTRLKEIFDLYKSDKSFGILKYDSTPVERGVEVSVYRERPGKRELLGKAVSSLKQDAEKKASEIAISTLKSQGIKKEIPELYKKFCGKNK